MEAYDMHDPHYVTAHRVYYMALKHMDDDQNEDEGESKNMKMKKRKRRERKGKT
jgi:hypothetical protein